MLDVLRHTDSYGNFHDLKKTVLDKNGFGLFSREAE